MAQLPVCSVTNAADTNATSLSIARVCEPAADTLWKYLQINEISSFSAELSTVSRDPISLDRMARKGTITGLAASPAFTSDNFMDMVRYFGDAQLYSTWKGQNPFGKLPTATTTTGYTVPTGPTVTSGSLVYAAGWAAPANNGLKVVGVGSTATEIKVAGLTVETAPASAVLHVVGGQAVLDGVSVDADGNLNSVTPFFTSLGLYVGQWIHVGGSDPATRFANAENYGLARVSAITATKLTLSQREQAYTADPGTGKTIHIYAGSFVRNVPVDSGDFQKVRHTLEARYNTSPVLYEYARDAYCNTMALGFPLEDKATLEFGMVAKDIEAPVTTRKLGSGWTDMVQSEAFNTAADFMRLRVAGIDEMGYDTYFKDSTVTIDNGVTPEVVLGNLGAAFINLGNLAVTIETETVMVNGAVLAAIRNNTTVSLAMGLRNNDGGFVVDIPSMTMGDGTKNLARNEKVKVAVACTAFKDPVLGYAVGISLFGYLPPAL